MLGKVSFSLGEGVRWEQGWGLWWRGGGFVCFMASTSYMCARNYWSSKEMVELAIFSSISGWRQVEDDGDGLISCIYWLLELLCEIEDFNVRPQGLCSKSLIWWLEPANINADDKIWFMWNAPLKHHNGLCAILHIRFRTLWNWEKYSTVQKVGRWQAEKCLFCTRNTRWQHFMKRMEIV